MTLAEANVKFSSTGADKVVSDTKKVSSALETSAKNAKSFLSSISSTAAGVAIGNWITSLPEKFLDLGKTMFDASVEAESMSVRLTSVAGSAQQAARDMKLIKDIATFTPLTTKEVSNYGLALKSVGFNLNYALPLLGKLAAAKGPDPNRMQAFVQVLTKLSSGIMPDAEQAITAGLPNLKAKLAAAGLEFDKNGSFIASTKKVMAIFKQVVEKETGDAIEAGAKTTETKLASLQDALENFYVKAGNVLKNYFTPIIEATTKVLDLLTKTDVIGTLLQKMVNPIFGDVKNLANNINKKGFSDEFLKKLSDILAFISMIPENIKSLAVYLGQLFESLIRNLAIAIGKPLAIDRKIGEQPNVVKDFLRGLFGGAAPGITQIGKTAVKQLSGFGGLGEGAVPLPEFPRFKSGDPTLFYEQLKKANEMLKAPIKIPGASDDPGKFIDGQKAAKDAIDKQQRTLDLIQQNTKTQNELTLRNMTYGGGELAAQGISAVQMSGNRSVSSPLINASNDIARGVEKIVRGYSNSNNLNFSFRRS